MPPPPRRSWQPLASWLVAGAVGALVLCLSDLLVPPAAVAFPGHGKYFEEMVRDPLSLQGEFPQRILWPLLAHAAGWFGVGAVAFSQVMNGAFLAVVFWFARHRATTALDALLVTIAVGITGAVLVYKPMTCFSDTLNFLLLLLTVHHVQRPAVFWGLVLLASFSHEMVFFFAPWLVHQRCRAGGIWWREGLVLTGLVAVHAVWRAVVAAAGGGGSYDIAYYFAHNFWVPWLLPALWALWVLVVLAEFGPMLVIVAWSWWRGAAGTGRWGPWLYLAGILPLMLLAYDVMRFASFAFLPLVLGSIAFLRSARARVVFAALLVASIATYAWEHPVPSQQGGATFTRVQGPMMALVPGRLEEGKPMAFGPAMEITRESFVQQWPTVLAVGIAMLAIVALGGVLARYFAPGPEPEPGGEPRTNRNASP